MKSYLRNPRKYVIPTILSLSLWLGAAAPTQADVSGGMDAMWNQTAPSLGGVNDNYGGTLGGLSVRTPVRSFNVMAFDPPRFGAGCGGIDAYFGSFSMISEKNLQNLIRAIIANGTGYAAKIALDNLCPPCQNIMSGLQDWTTKINSQAKNTCQLSMAAVDYLRGKRNPSAFGDDSKGQSEAVMTASSGAAKDFAEANDNRTYGGRNTNRPADAAEHSTEYGNNMMNTLVSAGVFQDSGNGAIDTRPYGGDKAFLQMAMSLYGTQIILTGDKATSSPSGGIFVQGSADRIDKDLAPIWSFQDLVNGAPTGAALSEYQCKDFNINKADSCQEVGTGDSKFPGTRRYILNLLIGKQTAFGDGGSLGDSIPSQIQEGSIMAYLVDNSQQMTEQQIAFLRRLPKESVDALSQAARSSTQTAIQAADAAAHLYGEQMAAEMVLAMNKTISIAYSANVTASGKRIVALSPDQQKQLAALTAQAERYADSSNRATAHRNFVTMVRGAALLAGNSSGLPQ